MKPKRNMVLVRPIPRGEVKTKSGLIIPEMYQSPHIAAKVIAVGPGKRRDDGTRIPTDATVGDIVMISIHAGNKSKDDEGEFILLEDDQILADLED